LRYHLQAHSPDFREMTFDLEVADRHAPSREPLGEQGGKGDRVSGVFA
jgi:hypothetical protein